MIKISMDQPEKYQIKVPGEYGEHWSKWGSIFNISYEDDLDDKSLTVITGIFDQAALVGFLRHLYSLGIPLISVVCIKEK